ncbi:MAG: response regulator transcription factor [Tissierellia bacterium]|nr:response regulator transcription factor [Tissierellia bacterium]
MMTTILVVDDEKLLVKGLKRSLEQNGYNVLTAYDGRAALDLLEGQKIDLVLLDLMLPKIDGLEVCRHIRKTKDIPVIMLTARGENVDKKVGLGLGVDDYLTKPFNTRELVARIKAVLRLYSVSEQKKDSGIIKVGDLEIDGLRRKVLLNEKSIGLTAREFDLLFLMAANPGRVYTREKLMEIIWGSSNFVDLRTVDVHIRRLREKIESNSRSPEYILTKWGAGYFFRED